MLSVQIGADKGEAVSHAMGWLEFVAAMTKSLAWPLVVALVFVLFRREIKERIRDILKLSLPGVAAEFDKKADEVKSSLVVAQIDHNSYIDTSYVSDLFDIKVTRDQEIKSFENVGRIVAAWSQIENVVKVRLEHAGVEISKLGTSMQFLVAAKAHNFITPDQFNSLRGLLTMRNLAAHGRADDITENRVTEYLILANAILTVLEMTAPGQQ